MAGFGNWATLGGGGDPTSGLGSSFPQLGGYLGGSTTYGPSGADPWTLPSGSTWSIPDTPLATQVQNNASNSYPTDGGAWIDPNYVGASTAPTIDNSPPFDPSLSDVQHPRPGGTALGNNAMGDVGSWGQVPDLTQLWGNDGSFNSGLWNTFTNGTGMAPGGNTAGAFGPGGALSAGGAASGGMGAAGGGMNLGSLMSGLGGMMGGGAATAPQQSAAQPQTAAPDPYQQAYNNLAAQIQAQYAASQAAANTPQPQVNFAGGYTQDQLNKINAGKNLEQQAAIKAYIDQQNEPKAEAAVKAARTQDATDAATKADNVKTAKGQAAQSGGAYDTEGNYYANTAAIQKATDDYNAKQQAAKDAAQKTQDMANGLASGSSSTSGGGSSGDSGSGSNTNGSGSGYGQQSQQDQQKQGGSGGWGDAINSFLGSMKGFGF